MARDYAAIRLFMWSDAEFRSLSPEGQHLYFVKLTSPSLSYCGVDDWRPRRTSILASGWTVPAIEKAAAELEERRYCLVDDDTEEILVRSFLRHDGVLKSPNLAVAMARDFAKVISMRLRGVIVHELKRLHEEFPEWSSWDGKASKQMLAEMLEQPSLDPFSDGFLLGSVNPSGKGSENPSIAPSSGPSRNPRGKGSAKGSGTPAPSPSPLTSTTSAPSERGDADATPGEIHAGVVVQAWVDECLANGVNPSIAQKGQVGRMARELLAKNDPTRVLEAARVAGAKGFASIDRELTALNGRPVPPRPLQGVNGSGGTADDRVAALQALKTGGGDD